MSDNEHVATLLDELAALQRAVFHRFFKAADSAQEASRLEAALQQATRDLAEGGPCENNEDCPPGFECIDGECRPIPDADLKPGFSAGKYS